MTPPMCAERRAFLTAIRADPADDVVRLAYADWLDERGGRGDLDAATAEFVRLGCTGVARREIRPAAANWLLDSWPGGRAENWRRLVPSTVAVDRAHAPGFETDGFARRSGRTVSWPVWLPSPRLSHRRDLYRDGKLVRLYAVELDFHRGFLAVARFASLHAAGALLEAILADQPLAAIEVRGLRAARAADLAALLDALAGEGAAKAFLARCA